MSDSAERLVKGIENVDRMNRKISVIVETILRFLPLLPRPSINKPGVLLLRIPSEHGEWTLHTGYSGLGYDIYLLSQNGLPVISSDEKYKSVPLIYVEQIYRSLPALVDGMIEKFPDLVHQLLPFFRAAEVEM